MVGVRDVLLSARWLVRTAVAVAWVGTCLRLGWWQWDRAAATASPQNVGYALQWPLFALFGAFAWWRMLRLEVDPPAPGPPPPAPPPGGPVQEDRTAPAAVLPATGTPSSDAAPSTPDEPDDELAAYNRYLRALHLHDQRHGR